MKNIDPKLFIELCERYNRVMELLRTAGNVSIFDERQKGYPRLVGNRIDFYLGGCLPIDIRCYIKIAVTLNPDIRTRTEVSRLLASDSRRIYQHSFYISDVDATDLNCKIVDYLFSFMKRFFPLPEVLQSFEI